MRGTLLPLSIVLLGVACGPSWADQEADLAAIEATASQFGAAFNDGDASRLAAFWTPDAVYENPLSGARLQGRDAIAKEFNLLLQLMDKARLSVDVESIELLSPSAAVEHGFATVVRGDGSREHLKYMAVHVKRDGQWLLDRVTEEEAPVAPSHYEKLKALEWLVGDWVDDTDNAEISFNCDWSKNQSFLVRSFVASVDYRVNASGVQWIGWDPKTEQLRSWTFDSNGAFADAVWSRTDEGWRSRRSATLAGGRTASAEDVITVQGKDRFTWRVEGRAVDGTPLPDIGEVVMVRAGDKRLGEPTGSDADPDSIGLRGP